MQISNVISGSKSFSVTSHHYYTLKIQTDWEKTQVVLELLYFYGATQQDSTHNDRNLPPNSDTKPQQRSKTLLFTAV